MARNGSAFIGIEGRTAAPAEVFDAFVLESAGGPRRHFARSFEVVAFPGEAPSEVLPGDLLLRRALGEGGLGSLATVESPESFGTGRLARDQMLLRPRREGGPAGEAAGSDDLVRWLQTGLNQAAGAQLAVDGDFGAKTRTALKSFQSRLGLAQSGEPGPREMAALVALGAGDPPGAGSGTQGPSWCDPAASRPDGLLGQIYFPSDAALLDTADAAALDELAAAVQALPAGGRARIELRGAADPKGTKKHNAKLGLARAEAVLTYLKTRLGGDSRLDLALPVSLGELTAPKGAQEADLALLRRVDIAGPPIAAPDTPSPDDPLTSKEAGRLPARAPRSSGEEVEIPLRLLTVAADLEDVSVEQRLVETVLLSGGPYQAPRQASTAAGATGATGTRARSVEIIATLRPGRRLGARVLPAPPREVQVPRPDPRAASGPRIRGFVPEHLPVRTVPRPLDPELLPAIDPSAPGARRFTTVFGADARTPFSDTSYPFSAAGRVTRAIGSWSGTLVGPRHVLTCNHPVWRGADLSVAEMTFSPAFSELVSPYGAARVTHCFFYEKARPPIDPADERGDYAVLVLDQPLGEVCGWLGARSYSRTWDGRASWSHIGYPLSAGSLVATFGTGIALASFYGTLGDDRLDHHADIENGHSGGPFYGWWEGETWASAVAVQSTEAATENSACGGKDMIHLISVARTDFP